MDFSKEEIKEYYRSLSDDKIESIAINDARGLRAEVVSVLKGEIARRGLDVELTEGVTLNTRDFREEELAQLISRIRALPCPKCESTRIELRAFELNLLSGFFLIATHQIGFKVLCKACGQKLKVEYFVRNLVFGIWAPRNLIKLPFLLIGGLVDLFRIDVISDRKLKELIRKNLIHPGQNKVSDQMLLDIIYDHNFKFDRGKSSGILDPS